MKSSKIIFAIIIITFYACQSNEPIIIDETDKTESIVQSILIDSVWAGHPVDFCLYTHGNKQYIAYYNANRNMVVGQRNLEDNNFNLFKMPPTYRETSGGTSTVLDWGSHNNITIGIDKDGFIHLAGNMHVHPITYFKSTKHYDIKTLVQEKKLVGRYEDKCTYPNFMLTKNRELVFHYRNGVSGDGNEIYNIYSCESKSWSRLLDAPLTDGQGLMNAYQTPPTIMSDGWYHVYWVWRDTPDCATNHDLSYMKSPDLKNWFNAFGEKIELPATPEKSLLIVDPIPVNGGIINLAAELCLDEKNNPVLTYHKYDAEGNLQLYIAQNEGKKWVYKQITNWDYRWEFSGFGSIKKEILINGFNKREDGNYEIDYWHKKYGEGTILLNNNFDKIGKVVKRAPLESSFEIEGDFPELMVQTSNDIGETTEKNIRYMLKWETLRENRDQPRPKPWTNASRLVLLKIKKAQN